MNVCITQGRSSSNDLAQRSRTAIDPQEPADAPPGSLEKVEVLRLRLSAQLPLWHPLDWTDDSSRERSAGRFSERNH